MEQSAASNCKKNETNGETTHTHTKINKKKKKKKKKKKRKKEKETDMWPGRNFLKRGHKSSQ